MDDDRDPPGTFPCRGDLYAEEEETYYVKKRLGDHDFRRAL